MNGSTRHAPMPFLLIVSRGGRRDYDRDTSARTLGLAKLVARKLRESRPGTEVLIERRDGTLVERMVG